MILAEGTVEAAAAEAEALFSRLLALSGEGARLAAGGAPHELAEVLAEREKVQKRIEPLLHRLKVTGSHPASEASITRVVAAAERVREADLRLQEAAEASQRELAAALGEAVQGAGARGGYRSVAAPRAGMVDVRR